MDIINHKLVDDTGNEHHSPGNYIGPEIHPRYIILHCTATASPFERNVRAFERDGYEASVHLLIGRAGEIHQFVPFNAAAAHCGDNHWHNVYHNMDRYSIGIEMLNAGLLDTDNQLDYYKVNAGITYTIPEDDRVYEKYHWWQIYPPAQLQAAEAGVRLLFQHYSELIDVLGHNEINPVQRSNDPGPAFPLQRFHNRVLGLDENLPVTRVQVTMGYSRLYVGPGNTYESLGAGYPRNTPLGVLRKAEGWSYVHVNPDDAGPPFITGWIPSARITEDTLKPRHYHRPDGIQLPA
jgi:N-acetylmuramoyl-L-alanine amidase